MSYRLNMKPTKKLKISAAPKQTTRLKNSLKVKPNYKIILYDVFG